MSGEQLNLAELAALNEQRAHAFFNDARLDWCLEFFSKIDNAGGMYGRAMVLAIRFARKRNAELVEALKQLVRQDRVQRATEGTDVGLAKAADRAIAVIRKVEVWP
jgi:hypothetical protein